MNTRFHNKRLAFTLVELLAVVVVLGILIALLSPAVNSVIERSRGATCAANMRAVATALLAYRGDYGWFPPGYPAAPTAIEDGQGKVLNGGVNAANFNSTLVPRYLGELPICPSARLSAEELKKYPNAKARFQSLGGTYGINAILLQWKLHAMPGPTWDYRYPYSASKMVFLLETGYGSVTWNQIHQNQALNGVVSSKPLTKGRNHGRGDTLNFMFLDGHVEAISRNDTRKVDEESKSWVFDTNPNGRFHPWGKDGLYIDSSRMNQKQFLDAYPHYNPNP